MEIYDHLTRWSLCSKFCVHKAKKHDEKSWAFIIKPNQGSGNTHARAHTRTSLGDAWAGLGGNHHLHQHTDSVVLSSCTILNSDCGAVHSGSERASSGTAAHHSGLSAIARRSPGMPRSCHFGGSW